MSAPTNRVVVDPAVVLQETMALNEWYRNRNLIFAHDNQMLRKQVTDLQAEQRIGAEHADMASGE